jgi:copper chaperone
MSEARTILLDVKGMTCQGCVNSVTRIIKKADPSAEVHIDLASGRVEARSAASPDALAAAVSGAGYEARPA